MSILNTNQHKLLFIWNKNNYAEFILTNYFGKDSVSTSFKRFKEMLDIQQDFYAIVILTELTWNGKKLCDFCGFEILSQLRAEYRLKCPIAMCSFMSEPWLRKKFPILEFPQHHPFIRLPASLESFIEKINKAEFADEPKLNDIIINYCDPIGQLIRLITHGKGFRQITRNVGVNKDDESLWANCSDDLALLRNYLANKHLGNTILSMGNALAVKIEDAIKTKNLENLLATKSTFDTLLDELANIKSNLIDYLIRKK